MGTTVTAAYLDGDNVVVAHVGDSRAYLLRDGDLIRLTRDHSLVGELVARGKLTEEQAETHPQRSVITRALGAYPDVEVDTDVYPARAGDLFLLCSDGLTGMVHEPRPQADARGPQPLARADRPRADRRRERGRRARQHHRDPVPARGRRGPARRQARARAAATLAGEPTAEYDTFEGESVPREGVSKPDRGGGRRGRGRVPAPRHRGPAGDRAGGRCSGSGPRATGAHRPAAGRAPRAQAAQAPHRHGPAARRDRHPGARRRVAGDARGLLRRHRARSGAQRDDLPRAALRAAVRGAPVPDVLRVRRPADRRAAGAPRRASPTTSCARATTPRIS